MTTSENTTDQHPALPDIDVAACAALVRQVTDDIASSGPRTGSAVGVRAQIGQVRALSRQAEDRLRAELKSLAPDVTWLGEENRPETSDYWLYDPIDGAYHYLQGLPLWSAALCLVRDSQPILSIVYDPFGNEVFTAISGSGARLGDQRIGVGPKDDFAAAVLGTAIPPIAQVGLQEQQEALGFIGRAASKAFVVRPMAAVSLQLAYVAAGRLDGYFENGRDAADWIAGALLVAEAGGLVTHLDGATFGWAGEGIVAANATLHPQLLETISGK